LLCNHQSRFVFGSKTNLQTFDRTQFPDVSVIRVAVAANDRNHAVSTTPALSFLMRVIRGARGFAAIMPRVRSQTITLAQARTEPRP
jgi:hypothetical protein